MIVKDMRKVLDALTYINTSLILIMFFWGYRVIINLEKIVSYTQSSIDYRYTSLDAIADKEAINMRIKKLEARVKILEDEKTQESVR